MKIVITFIFAGLFQIGGFCQQVITLEQCYQAAESNYPLVRQRGLIKKASALTVENAAKAGLPRIHLGGQATYQSDVTQIPVEMPGVEPLSKDQYRVFGEVAQTLYHGGLVARQEEAEAISALEEEQQLAVELYEIRNRVNELFFGILLLQEQIAQRRLVRKDLNTGLSRTRAAIDNGTAIRSAAYVLEAELLRIDQAVIEMKASQDLYREMLGLLTGQVITAEAVLQRPVFGTLSALVQRPEQRLFDIQRQKLTSGLAVLSARNKPGLELFVQGGYGRPGLNMLENSFNPYYLAGLRFSWQLSDRYTLRRDREILALRRQALDVREETFLFNTDLSLRRYRSDVTRLRRLIEVDNDIIALQARVRETAEAQLAEGVISSTDFVREVNAEDQARQNRILHETQLLMAQAAYHFTAGNH